MKTVSYASWHTHTYCLPYCNTTGSQRPAGPCHTLPQLTRVVMWGGSSVVSDDPAWLTSISQSYSTFIFTRTGHGSLWSLLFSSVFVTLEETCSRSALIDTVTLEHTVCPCVFRLSLTVNDSKRTLFNYSTNRNWCCASFWKMIPNLSWVSSVMQL